MYLKTSIPVIHKDKDSVSNQSELCLFIKQIDSLNAEEIGINYFYESRKIQEIEHIDGGLVKMEVPKFEYADFTVKSLIEINYVSEENAPINLSEEKMLRYKAYELMKINMYNHLLKDNSELTINHIELIH